MVRWRKATFESEDILRRIKPERSSAFWWLGAGGVFVLCYFLTLSKQVDGAAVTWENIFEIGAQDSLHYLLELVIAVAMICLLARLHPRKDTAARFLLMLLPGLLLFFSAFPAAFTFDSLWYHQYELILLGQMPFSEWNVIRGFGFPLFLVIIHKLFGATLLGVRSAMFLCYLLFQFFGLRFLTESGKEPKKNPVIFSFYTLLVVFNPLLLCMFHVCLTEFIAATLSMAALYYVWKWSKIPAEKETIWQHIRYGLFFSVDLVLLYQIKQPFALGVLVPVFAAVMLRLLRRFDCREILTCVGMMGGITAVLAVSLATWSTFLDLVGAYGKGAQIAPKLSYMVHFSEEMPVSEKSDREIQSDPLLSEEEKAFCLSDEVGGSVFYAVSDWGGNIVERVILRQKAQEATGEEQTAFYWEQWRENPQWMISSYFRKYLGIWDILKVTSNAEEGKRFYPETKLESGYGYESWVYYYRCFRTPNEGENLLDTFGNLIDNPNLANLIEAYTSTYTIPQMARTYIEFSSLSFANLSFRLMGIFAPLGCVIGLWGIVKRKKKSPPETQTAFLLMAVSGLAFSSSLLHIVGAAAIDRYMMPSYALAAAGILIWLCDAASGRRKTDED